jgi:hypothetical protein
MVLEISLCILGEPIEISLYLFVDIFKGGYEGQFQLVGTAPERPKRPYVRLLTVRGITTENREKS